MADIATLLDKIPDEYQPAAAVGIGAFILMGIVLFHGACLHRILIQYKRGSRRLRMGRPVLIAGLLLFAWSIFLMLGLHLAEIAIWAAALKGLGVIKHANEAVYFCANSYSTLGFGKVDLSEHWRNISPIGISGLVTFAWTTSLAVDVVAAQSKLMDQLEEEREQQMQMRLTMRKEQWEVLKKERDAERSEREKTKTQVAGSSFFQRRRIWKEEKKREEELRRARATEIADLRRKERLAEEKLGAGKLATDDEDKEA